MALSPAVPGSAPDLPRCRSLPPPVSSVCRLSAASTGWSPSNQTSPTCAAVIRCLPATDIAPCTRPGSSPRCGAPPSLPSAGPSIPRYTKYRPYSPAPPPVQDCSLPPLPGFPVPQSPPPADCFLPPRPRTAAAASARSPAQALPFLPQSPAHARPDFSFPAAHRPPRLSGFPGSPLSAPATAPGRPPPELPPSLPAVAAHARCDWLSGSVRCSSPATLHRPPPRSPAFAPPALPPAHAHTPAAHPPLSGSIPAASAPALFPSTWEVRECRVRNCKQWNLAARSSGRAALR